MKAPTELTLEDMSIPVGAAPCKKCGNEIVGMWWCDGITFIDCSNLLWWSQDLLASHLHNQCERCQREWFSVPLDSNADHITEEMRVSIDFYKDYAEEEYADSERLIFRGKAEARETEGVDTIGDDGSGGLPREGRRDDLRSSEEIRPVVVLNQVQDDSDGPENSDSPGDDNERIGKRVRRVKASGLESTKGRSDSNKETPPNE